MTAYDFLNASFSEKLRSVEEVLHDSMTTFTKLKSIEYAKKMLSSGKRIRALLSLLSFALCKNADTNAEIRAAATIELIHNATLMHDDVVDENSIRRGKPNIKSIHGNKISVLTGDFLLSVAFEIILECKNLSVVLLLSKTAKQLSEGEMLQLQSIGEIVSESEYLEVIARKTAVLFSAAAEIAAILTGKQEYVVILREIGFLIGMAFQITDDVLDYGEPQEVGKSVGNDFRECKFTLPCVIAYRDAKSKAAKKFWREVFFTEEKDIQEARFFMYEVDALAKAMEVARKYLSKAEKKLSIFENGASLLTMKTFLRYAAERPY
ncbi:polyprenyl synthetase family protein [Neorickettsia sennetsu]|uniref:Polyprenyl synthetase family protein n=1 Tax=Ehrlichia sennetsu (strain ATCC VR-367 / Miyayama) TaxID=222891 RepID=Q2GEG4_EHRS3|nr:polyprenyl synthetase family protein [Neorickettsia sennetsu]ABD45598.1 polyprenyl synthetase family protein [Neorickettsia sennetsu str. Miyayama]